jgi:hypothetical protein
VSSSYQLFADLSSNLSVRMSYSMHINVSVASFDLSNQIQDRFPLQWTDQVTAGQHSLYNSASYGYTEFRGTEQEGDYRSVLPSSTKMDVGFSYLFDVTDDKAKSKARVIITDLKYSISTSDCSNRRYLFTSG